MIQFQMFRVKVHFPNQGTFFRENRSPSDVLREVIKSLPCAELRTGRIWHIGNVEPVGMLSLYFRIGRSSRSTLEVFKNGKFMDQEFETAPYTHVVVDTELEVCAIARKPRLAKNPLGIARQLARLLRQSETAKHLETTFEIVELLDPEGLIQYLRSAVAISKFSLTFSRPNPFDVNQYFQAPMEKYLEYAKGQKGKTEISGENLESDVLEDLARSAAATGENASASLQTEQGGPRLRKHLRPNPVFIQHEDLSDSDAKASMLEEVRRKYREIRQDIGDGS